MHNQLVPRRHLTWMASLLAARMMQLVAVSGADDLSSMVTKPVTASIYSTSGGARQLLFKFKRVVEGTAGKQQVNVEYTYPDGKLAAKERIDYENGKLLRYELDQLQTGAKGSATLERSGKPHVRFEYTPPGGASSKTEQEALAENTLINDTVGPFIFSHFDQLERGEKLKARFIVVSRRETVGFTFLKQSDLTWEGKPVLIIRMEATSSIVGTLVNPLTFTVEKGPSHRVLQYIGRTVPKLQVGGKWKDLDALTVFDWEGN